MTTPRDGDLVRVVVEGVFSGSPSVGGSMRGYVTLDDGAEVFLTEAALGSLEFEIVEAVFPGPAGTVWLDRDGERWFVVDPERDLRPGTARLIVSLVGERVAPSQAWFKYGPMRRTQVGDPS